MIYLVAALAGVGLVVLALARRRVPVEARCPTCRTALESVEVERCPTCQLWHPVDAGARRYRWQRDRLVVGVLLLALPGSMYALLPIVTRYTLARPKPRAVPILPLPAGGGASRGLTPQQMQQLAALGYLQQSPTGLTIKPVPTSAPASMPPDLAARLRSLGYAQVDDAAAPSSESAEADESGDDKNEDPP